jgi:putative copper resistance protein D
VQDVHWGGAIMWIAGDAIMFAVMLLVLLAWSREHRASWGMSGWLEAARKSRFDEVVAPGGPATARPGRGGIDDDEHLAAYNAYLARLHGPGADGTG